MACTSLTAFTADACDALQGGAKTLHMIAAKDLANITGQNNFYSIDAVSKEVDEIKVATGKNFVNVGLYPKAPNGFTLAVTKDATVGTFYFTSTLVFQTRTLTQPVIDFISSVGNQPVVALIEDKQGRWYLLGVNKDMELTTMDGTGIGNVADDGQNLNLTFEGTNSLAAYLVDDTIIAALLEPAA